MSRITHILTGAVLAVLINAVVAISAAATPDSASDRRTLVVRYSDLSLNRPADIKQLYHRIGVAADNVCGPREMTGSRLERPSYRSCFDAAVSNAIGAVASPALSAYYHTQLTTSHAHALTLARR